MQTFDIVHKKYIFLVYIDSMGIFSWYGLTIRTKVVMIQQKYEAITEPKSIIELTRNDLHTDDAKT